MKAPQQTLMEELKDYIFTQDEETVKNLINENFPPPSKDGVEEIARKTYDEIWDLNNTKEQDIKTIKQAILADRLARESKSCVWKHDECDDSWDTQCDNKFQFTNDGPKENNFEFCSYCGGRLITAMKVQQ